MCTHTVATKSSGHDCRGCKEWRQVLITAVSSQLLNQVDIFSILRSAGSKMYIGEYYFAEKCKLKELESLCGVDEDSNYRMQFLQITFTIHHFGGCSQSQTICSHPSATSCCRSGHFLIVCSRTKRHNQLYLDLETTMLRQSASLQPLLLFGQVSLWAHKDFGLICRFAHLPLITHDKVGFYAGTPIVSSRGHRLGTVCFVAGEARKFDAEGSQMLINMGELITRELERDWMTAQTQTSKPEVRPYFITRIGPRYSQPFSNSLQSRRGAHVRLSCVEVSYETDLAIVSSTHAGFCASCSQ